MSRTHEVVNQPPPLVDFDVFGGDRALGEAVRREGAEWALDKLHALGKLAGGEAIAWGVQANGAGAPITRSPRFTGWRPSASLAGSTRRTAAV